MKFLNYRYQTLSKVIYSTSRSTSFLTLSLLWKKVKDVLLLNLKIWCWVFDSISTETNVQTKVRKEISSTSQVGRGKCKYKQKGKRKLKVCQTGRGMERRWWNCMNRGYIYISDSKSFKFDLNSVNVHEIIIYWYGICIWYDAKCFKIQMIVLMEC